MAASDLEKSFRELAKTENVFFFVPNLIGYARQDTRGERFLDIFFYLEFDSGGLVFFQAL
jgi:hypothetical protein